MSEGQINRRELALRSVVVIIAAVIITILGLLTYSALTGREILQEIESCTTPDGECSKRGEAATGNAVTSLNNIIVAAATCADEPGVQGRTEIEMCMRDMLLGGG